MALAQIVKGEEKRKPSKLETFSQFFDIGLGALGLANQMGAFDKAGAPASAWGSPLANYATRGADPNTLNTLGSAKNLKPVGKPNMSGRMEYL